MSIRKIGEKLREGIKLTEEENLEFEKFRETHNTIRELFISELEKIKVFEENLLVASRIKRIETIISKLKRPQKPKLNSIHDIAGTRIIFENIEKLESYIDVLEHTKLNNFQEKNIETRDKYNYIKNPKPDGYRSIHKVFCYSSNDNNDLKNKKIELQLRTKIQHIWATTVEIYDIVNKSSIKTGTYNKLATKEGLFFKKCSVIFEGIENNEEEKIKDNICEIFENKDLIKIYKKLKGIKNIARIKLPQTLEENEVFILITYPNKGYTTFFTTDDFPSINTSYRVLEENNVNGEYILLLLTLKNIKKLKETYPNYFLDTNNFINILEKYKNKYIKEEV